MLKDGDVSLTQKRLKTTGQLAFFQYSRKYWKGARLHKCLVFWVTLCQNKSVASKKAIALLAFLALLEKWKRVVDSGIWYFSEAFDCLEHELQIAKLNTYSFSLTALKIIYQIGKKELRYIELIVPG